MALSALLGIQLLSVWLTFIDYESCRLHRDSALICSPDISLHDNFCVLCDLSHSVKAAFGNLATPSRGLALNSVLIASRKSIFATPLTQKI